MYTLGRSPAALDISISIRDLDAAGHINNVQPVLIINGDRPGFYEPSLIKSLATLIDRVQNTELRDKLMAAEGYDDFCAAMKED